MTKLLNYLDRQPAPSLLALALALVALLDVVNYYAGTNISLLFFYVVPIFLVAWFVGRRAGVVMTALSGVSWLAIALISADEQHRAANPAVPMWNAAVRFGFILFTSVLISNFRRSFDHERELARTDFLTGAVNSRAFRELAEAEISRAARYGRPFTVAYMDVDDFKNVNDRAGHSAGDALLREVSETIKRHVRDIDVVARLGGDEFAVLLPEAGGDAARAAIERVRTSLLYAAKKNKWPVTFSIGVVTWEDVSPASADDMLKEADAAMYAAKRGGKNRVHHRLADEEAATAA